MSGVTFWVPGQPAPQGSKRHVGGGRMIEMSRTVAPWRQAVAWSARGARGIAPAGPVRVTVEFAFTRPAGHYGTGRNAGRVRASAPARPAVRPDLDKLVRSTLDGLKTGGAYRDDSQVCELTARKIYAAAPGAMITIEPIPDSELTYGHQPAKERETSCTSTATPT